MNETSSITMMVFLLYIVGVFVLAGLSHRLLSKRSFLSEYFLGSRGLGTWALAFTFAATSASGGSFGGYPSLIYSYGWVLALWIGSYMMVPLCTMGIMGKRLNQVARISNAITIPDVLRDRFESPAIGLISSGTMVFFTICFLVAQFKLGAIIIEDTFNLQFDYAYEVSLIIFAVVVIFYTSYGGFRAVVWTDVMQGIVMGLGVLVLIPIVLNKTGGLEKATKTLAQQPPMAITSVPGPDGAKGTFNDLVFHTTGTPAPAGIAYRNPEKPNSPLLIHWQSDDELAFAEITMATDAKGQVTTTANQVKRAVEQDAVLGNVLKIEFPYKNNDTETVDGVEVSHGATGVIWFPEGKSEYRYPMIHGHELVFGPGRTNEGRPFHTLGMILSFFTMWAITGMAQPSTMVRLIAFKDSRTLKRAIITVSIYFGMIYLPLIAIVMAARSALPVLTPEESDRAIVLIATRLVSDMSIPYQMLGAIFIAAPFAAVMSTVDSMLLLISSSAVRDVYQRTINPDVSQRKVKIISYSTTAVAGVLITLAALHPPNFLQKLLVFGAGGLASSFLFPTLLGIFWKGTTRQGALAAMIGGFCTTVGLFLPTLLGGTRIDSLGLHPSLWGLIASATLGIAVSKATGPPPPHLVRRYFYKQPPT
ncbi:MAG: hypothetical protein GXP26_14890 [Planctomycetes bacterium]|nr:hypothetical protein [Planctomycetota bacterium]